MSIELAFNVVGQRVRRMRGLEVLTTFDVAVRARVPSEPSQHRGVGGRGAEVISAAAAVGDTDARDLIGAI